MDLILGVPVKNFLYLCFRQDPDSQFLCEIEVILIKAVLGILAATHHTTGTLRAPLPLRSESMEIGIFLLFGVPKIDPNINPLKGLLAREIFCHF